MSVIECLFLMNSVEEEMDYILDTGLSRGLDAECRCMRISDFNKK